MYTQTSRTLGRFWIARFSSLLRDPRIKRREERATLTTGGEGPFRSAAKPAEAKPKPCAVGQKGTAHPSVSLPSFSGFLGARFPSAVSSFPSESIFPCPGFFGRLSPPALPSPPVESQSVFWPEPTVSPHRDVSIQIT